MNDWKCLYCGKKMTSLQCGCTEAIKGKKVANEDQCLPMGGETMNELATDMAIKIVRSVVINCQYIDDTEPKDEVGQMTGPTWGKVAHMCGIGSTAACEICRLFDVNPHYDCAKDTQDEQVAKP